MIRVARALLALTVAIGLSACGGSDGSPDLGSDASQYNKRSVFPGILNVDVPIVLAWAADDSAGKVAQGETWWADLPDPTGSGPGFRRPVVIVQGDHLNRSRIATIVCRKYLSG